MALLPGVTFHHPLRRGAPRCDPSSPTEERSPSCDPLHHPPCRRTPPVWSFIPPRVAQPGTLPSSQTALNWGCLHSCPAVCTDSPSQTCIPNPEGSQGCRLRGHFSSGYALKVRPVSSWPVVSWGWSPQPAISCSETEAAQNSHLPGLHTLLFLLVQKNINNEVSTAARANIMTLIDLSFKSSCRFIERLSRKSPVHKQFPILTSCMIAMSVTTEIKPILVHIIDWSPWFATGFSVSVLWVGTSVQSHALIITVSVVYPRCIHHRSALRTRFTALKTSKAPLTHPSLPSP